MPLALARRRSNPVLYGAGDQNIRQAITLSIKHKDRRDRNLEGFKFAVPFDYSMHLLRYYREHGSIDRTCRSAGTREMVNLRADNIDGFLGPDPMNQRAVYDGGLYCQRSVGRPSLFAFALQEFISVHRHLCGAAQGNHRRVAFASRPRTEADRRKSRRRYIQPM